MLGLDALHHDFRAFVESVLVIAALLGAFAVRRRRRAVTATTFLLLAGSVLIDTGARFELMLTKSFAAQADLRAKHPNGIDSVYGWGVGGPIRGYVTRASEMRLGDVQVNDVVTDLSLQDRGGLSGSIGGGILKRFVVTLDYAHQTIYLKPRPQPIADAGTFDRAGMWFNASTQGFEIVDVAKGAPAEQAGLHVGDTILAGGIGKQTPETDLRRQMMSIGTKLLRLPLTTALYPGHGPATSLERELAQNPVFRGVGARA